MNLDQLAKAGEAAAQAINLEQTADAAVFQIVIEPNGEDSTTSVSVAGTEQTLGPALARLFSAEPEVRQLFEKALKIADEDCPCPACQIRRALESGQDPTDAIKATVAALTSDQRKERIKNDPTIN